MNDLTVISSEIDSVKAEIVRQLERNTHCNTDKALDCCRVLLGQLNFAPHDSDVFVSALRGLFEDFSEECVMKICDPRSGYATRHKSADIKNIRQELISAGDPLRRTMKDLNERLARLRDRQEDAEPSEDERKYVEEGFVQLKELISFETEEQVKKSWKTPQCKSHAGIRRALNIKPPKENSDGDKRQEEKERGEASGWKTGTEESGTERV